MAPFSTSSHTRTPSGRTLAGTRSSGSVKTVETSTGPSWGIHPGNLVGDRLARPAAGAQEQQQLGTLDGQLAERDPRAGLVHQQGEGDRCALVVEQVVVGDRLLGSAQPHHEHGRGCHRDREEEPPPVSGPEVGHGSHHPRPGGSEGGREGREHHQQRVARQRRARDPVVPRAPKTKGSERIAGGTPIDMNASRVSTGLPTLATPLISITTPQVSGATSRATLVTPRSCQRSPRHELLIDQQVDGLLDELPRVGVLAVPTLDRADELVEGAR